jgi:hypothetical protein
MSLASSLILVLCQCRARGSHQPDFSVHLHHYFAEMLDLRDNSGAKKATNRNARERALLECASGRRSKRPSVPLVQQVIQAIAKGKVEEMRGKEKK